MTRDERLAASGGVSPERQLPVGLVHQQHRPRVSLDQRDDPSQVRLGDHLAGGVVGRGDAHQPCLGSQEGGERVRVHPPRILVGQVEDRDVGADGPWRLEVGGVVGTRDHEVVAGREEARRER